MDILERLLEMESEHADGEGWFLTKEERNQAVTELERLRAIETGVKELLPTIAWWSDGYDDAVVYRCVGCDVERDDVQSGVDTHHENCRVGKLIALLDRKP
jgi:hypothetical protein